MQKKQELEERPAKIRKDMTGCLNLDFEEQAVQLENRDMLLAIVRVTEEELFAVKNKLRDMD